MPVLLLALLLGTFHMPQVQINTAPFKGLFGRSQVVLVNGARSGVVVPCVDGIDIIRETKENGKKSFVKASLQPGEPATISVRAPHGRRVNVVFKYYDDQGTFLGATRPVAIQIPALPATVSQTVVFATSQLKG